MLDLSIIIVSYNTKEFLKKCLESILYSIEGKFSYEIIVVDNASEDESIAFLKSQILIPDSIGDKSKNQNLKLKIIENEENLGFSKANNIGVKWAKGRYLLFLNPDTIVYPKTLETIVEFMDKHEDAGAATCKVVMPNGEMDDACHRGFPTPLNAFCHFSGLSKLFPHLKLFNGYSLEWMDLSKIHEIDAVSGAFIIVRRVAGEKIGWWDEDYFWYGEDLDFCYRLKKRGCKIYYVPTVSILHYKGVSGGIKTISKKITTASQETKRKATIARFEAMKIFYRKHYMDKYPKIVTLLVMLAINFKLWFSLKKV